MKIEKIFYSVAALALCLGLAASCRPGGSTTDHKVFLLGVDALDWEMVDALRSQGLLPNLDRLIKKGVSAQLDTNDEGGSAVYWTTIATGQKRAKHGIMDFVHKDPQSGEINPVTSNQRKTKAFWNILSENDVSVGVTGWYVTWPAEKVNGFMVSSYFTWTDAQPTVRGMVYPDEAKMIYPPSLAGEVKDAVKRAELYYQKNIRKIVPLSSPAQRGPLVIKMEWSIMSDFMFAEVGTSLYRKLKPQVMGLYYGAVDVSGHLFSWKKAKRTKRMIAQRGADVQKNCYLATDELIGRTLALVDEETTVILLSDHGLMRGEHTNNGVFIMSGPDIKQGLRLEKRVGLTDVCPTLLYRIGLPVAEDMDGRVLLDAFFPEYVKAHRVKTVSSYGPRTNSSEKPIKSNFDGKIIERLKTLGYLK